MTNVEHYEILVFGGGKAGKTLSMEMARAGKRVAMIERGMIGGSCINVACIPTKALVRSSEVAHLARRAGEFGTQAAQDPVDMAAVAARTADVVAGMVEANQSAFNASGLELVLGEGRFVEPRVIEVSLSGGGTRRLSGDGIFLNLGTTAAVPDIQGLRDASPLTHVEALLLERLPRHLLVLGGGYIGLEMAQAYRRLGSAVTIVERGSQIAAREDPDVAQAVQDLLRDEGIDIVLEAKVIQVQGKSGDAVSIRLTTPAGEQVLEGSDVLVAAGRVPQTAGIGLEIAGVAVDERGFIRVDDRLATTAPGIWAMGEVAGSPMFTHVSLDDYRVARSVILGGDRTTKSRLVPYVVFIEPELGRVGLSETDAQRQGLHVRTARLPMSAVPRARTLGLTLGFMKAVIDSASDRILGFTMLGAHAGEVIAVVQTAMWADLPYTTLRDGIIAHPTMAEGLNILFSTVAAPVVRPDAP